MIDLDACNFALCDENGISYLCNGIESLKYVCRKYGIDFQKLCKELIENKLYEVNKETEIVII